MSRKPICDWTQVDWTKPDKLLAQELGTSIQVVGKNRIKHTDHIPRDRDAVDWSLVDLFNDSVKHICKTLGVVASTVYMKRYLALKKQGETSKEIDWSKVDLFNDDVKKICETLNISADSVYSKRIYEMRKQSRKTGHSNVDWSKVDLNLPVPKIAEITGLSKQAIYNRRNKFKKMTEQDWLNLDWSKSNTELVAYTGKTLSTVNTMRHRLGKSKPKKDQPPTDWDKVDWSINNRDLAKHLNLSYDTVAKKRWALQAGESAEKAPRKDKGISKTTYIPTQEQQQKATESAKKSPIAGKSETNTHAKEWVLVAPDDKIYHITNLHHFVRNNPHLFAEKDVVWKGKNGIEYYCNATAGIGNIKQGKSQSWKGWRLLNHDKNKD